MFTCRIRKMGLLVFMIIYLCNGLVSEVSKEFGSYLCSMAMLNQWQTFSLLFSLRLLDSLFMVVTCEHVVWSIWS